MYPTPTQNQPLQIEQIVGEANDIIQKMREGGTLTKRVLAIGIEINQRYVEYLEALETSELKIQTGITIQMDGKAVHFKNNNDFSNWLSENMT